MEVEVEKRIQTSFLGLQGNWLTDCQPRMGSSAPGVRITSQREKDENIEQDRKITLKII